MKKNIMQEMEKKRVMELRMSEVFNSTVIGILALWLVWVSTTLLIHFTRG